MRTSLAALTTIVLVVGVLGSATAGGGVSNGRPSCYPRETSTVLLTRAIRVYQGRRGYKSACLFRDGSVRRLDSPSLGYWTFPPPALAGRGSLLLRATSHDDLEGLSPKRETILRWARLGATDSFGPEIVLDARRGIGSARIKENASFGYIICPVSIDVVDPPRRLPRTCREPNGRFVYEVFKVEADQPTMPVRLDRGRKIDPDSLRLSGSTLSWREGMVLRRARLN